jgi:hypothetical protein
VANEGSVEAAVVRTGGLGTEGAMQEGVGAVHLDDRAAIGTGHLRNRRTELAVHRAGLYHAARRLEALVRTSDLTHSSRRTKCVGTHSCAWMAAAQHSAFESPMLL